MLRKILPVLMLLIGSTVGGGVGYLLKPEQVAEEAHDLSDATSGDVEASTHESDDAHKEEGTSHAEGDATHDYVKLNNQFVVPVVHSDRVESLVVLSLSVEVKLGENDKVYAVEPKLRDAFLQVLFDHANMGGFSGTFTSSNNMKILRRALLETAQKSTGELVSDVLITDIARQDI